MFTWTLFSALISQEQRDQVKLNLSELKPGFESATSYMWDDMTQTTYANVDVSGWAFVVAYCLFNTGQTYESPSYFYEN